MAKAQKKKATSTGRNPDRRNGKAFKKSPETGKRVRTEERRIKDEMIRLERERKREIGMARHAAELEAAKEAEERRLKILEEERAEIECRKKPHDPRGRIKGTNSHRVFLDERIHPASEVTVGEFFEAVESFFGGSLIA